VVLGIISLLVSAAIGFCKDKLKTLVPVMVGRIEKTLGKMYSFSVCFKIAFHQ
jgi:hypothetical protein